MLLRRLETMGFAVVEEAATDVIALEQARGVAEPWLDEGFVDAVAALQRRRLATAGERTGPVPGVQVYDRSPVCTLALARFQGRACSASLGAELARIAADAVYQRRVLFVRGLGFVTHTEARRIGLEDALRFERIHEETYRELGYELLDVPPGPVDERAERVRALLCGA
jgi:predicted ATPase